MGRFCVGFSMQLKLPVADPRVFFTEPPFWGMSTSSLLLYIYTFRLGPGKGGILKVDPAFQDLNGWFCDRFFFSFSL